MDEDGPAKSGLPSIYDSTYHATAISVDGVFVTVDKQHLAKAGQYGSVVLLAEWQGVAEGIFSTDSAE